MSEFDENQRLLDIIESGFIVGTESSEIISDDDYNKCLELIKFIKSSYLFKE